MEDAEKTCEKVLTEPVTETATKVTIHEGFRDRGIGDEKPAGYGLEMIPDEEYGDERDAEFERY